MFEVKILATADFVGAINNLAEAIKSISGGTTKNTLSEINNALSEQLAAHSSETLVPAAPVQQAPAVPSAPAPVPQAPAVPSAPAPVPQAPAVPSAPAPVQQAPTAAPVTDTHIQSATVPTAAPAYTLDMLSRAGAALVDAGKMPQLIELLQRYGVS